MLLLCNCSLDDCGMVCVWDQGDDDCVLANFSFERCLIGNIERDWYAVLEAFAELLCRVKRTACWGIVN